MKFLGEYIYTLSACLIIASVIFTSVPSGPLKNTLKAAVGIVLALVSVSAFIPDKADTEAYYESMKEVVFDENNADEMTGLVMEQTRKLAEKKISEKVGGKKVNITLNENGNIEKVEIENATKADKIVVSREFEIEIEKIQTS